MLLGRACSRSFHSGSADCPVETESERRSPGGLGRSFFHMSSGDQDVGDTPMFGVFVFVCARVFNCIFFDCPARQHRFNASNSFSGLRSLFPPVQRSLDAGDPMVAPMCAAKVRVDGTELVPFSLVCAQRCRRNSATLLTPRSSALPFRSRWAGRFRVGVVADPLFGGGK